MDISSTTTPASVKWINTGGKRGVVYAGGAGQGRAHNTEPMDVLSPIIAFYHVTILKVSIIVFVQEQWID